MQNINIYVTVYKYFDLIQSDFACETISRKSERVSLTFLCDNLL